MSTTPEVFTFTDADGDTLSICVPADPASGTPSVSFYTATGDPVHVPVEQIPALIVAIGERAGITPAPAPLSATERSFLRFALELAADAMANDASGFTGDDEAAHASLSKLAGEAS